MKKFLLVGSTLALVLAFTASAKADIGAIGLFNTGYDTNNNNVDDNWAFTDVLNNTGGTSNVAANATYTSQTGHQAYITDVSNGFPIPPWVANTTPGVSNGSRWISPQRTYNTDIGFGNQSDAVGIFVYQTQFSVANTIVSSTATVKWYNDNKGLLIRLLDSSNNQVGGNIYQRSGYIPGTTNPDDLSAATEFLAGSPTVNGQSLNLAGLGAGNYKLEFWSYNNSQFSGNDGNPTGTRVEFSGSIAAIPEPAFYQMSALLVGGGLMGIRMRRRQARK